MQSLFAIFPIEFKAPPNVATLWITSGCESGLLVIEISVAIRSISTCKMKEC